ncbi:hypothetical protein [Streptomyces sp. NPDC051310]|uniref:hypothetical protein n=1 Tax=Streptomyces sp. NPDC051310 TaxID=3365649 RepID=UPI00379807E2
MAQGLTVLAMRIDGTTTPVIAEQVEDGVRTAERKDHMAVLIELDTPGGFLQSTRDILQVFLDFSGPVIVHVAPSGARAASVGAYITPAGQIAATTPGTHIGAGTPFTGEGEKASAKLINDAAAFAVSIAEQRGRSKPFAEAMVRDGTALSAQEAAEAEAVDLLAVFREAFLPRSTAATSGERAATKWRCRPPGRTSSSTNWGSSVNRVRCSPVPSWRICSSRPARSP